LETVLFFNDQMNFLFDIKLLIVFLILLNNDSFMWFNLLYRYYHFICYILKYYFYYEI
jgi:hypothetical protein